AKERPLFDPLILHLPPSWQSDLFDRGLIDLEALSERGKEIVLRLTSAFWPGPLTIVVPKTGLVPDITTSGLPTTALRVPNHPIARRLLDGVGAPLAAPSANRFGRISPTRVEDVLEELGDRIDYLIDGGTCEIGLESTVARVHEDGAIELLRPGKIRKSELEGIGGCEVAEATIDPTGTGPEHSPGRLETHYAPRTSLALLGRPASREAEAISSEKRPAVLFWSDATLSAYLNAIEAEAIEESSLVAWRVLSSSGDPSIAGRNLFRMLRELDATESSVIFAELPEDDTGISHAIRDRLFRASRG
ncbi:MAG: L-threonylcarbamoyladenylate synthase, partial [Thermoanaerobaculia bacterium]|nr:L-threonylcarbamoyladenylate synthase [Thermoanaerobaculia bacterium]